MHTQSRAPAEAVTFTGCTTFDCAFVYKNVDIRTSDKDKDARFLFVSLLIFRLLIVYFVLYVWIEDVQVGGHITWVHTTTQLGLSGPPEYCT